MTDELDNDEWTYDAVATRDGRVLPVRATARRPTWTDLPEPVREVITQLTGSPVRAAASTGTGFTSGFASRLDLVDGRSVFVKAASSRTDERVGWPITDAYREEVRKLRGLPEAVPAPRLLWSMDDDVDGARWVALGFQAIKGRPPRRPWRPDELSAVCHALTQMAPALAIAPPELQLDSFVSEFARIDDWVARAVTRDGSNSWLDEVRELAHESRETCSGTALAHLDLRDDNILLDTAGRVWICDWNWPLLGAPWLDLVTVLISAAGDGLDADAVLAAHPLTAGVDPTAVNSFLATLWLYFTTAKEQPVPPHSPYIRHHQQWYEDATESWLRRRLGRT